MAAAAAAADEKDVAATIKGIGATGSLLYTAMLLFVGWRVYGFHRTGAARGEAAGGGFPARSWFHSFLLASVICDIPYYYKLAAGVVTTVSYGLHLVAIWLDLCAFSMVVVVWSRALQITRDAEKVLAYIIALDSFVLIYTLVVICIVIVSQTGVDGFVSSSPQSYLFLFLVNALVLLLYCAWLLAYGIRLQRAIRAHPRWEPLRRERRLRITMRINGVLAVCCSCFLLRVLLLLTHFLQAELGDEARFLDPSTLVSWYLFATWIPFLVPACTLLFMMRGAGPGGATSSSPTTLALAATGGAGLAAVGSGGFAALDGGNGGGGANGGAGPVGLAEWEEPLVLPGTNLQPVASREYVRLQAGNLYSPPPAAAAVEGMMTAAAASAGGGGGRRQGNGVKVAKKAAVLDLGDDEDEETGGGARAASSSGGGEEERKGEEKQRLLTAAAVDAAAAELAALRPVGTTDVEQ